MAESYPSAQPAQPTAPEALPKQDHPERAGSRMADTTFPITEPRPSGPTTPEAFIADRQHFWTQFTRAIVTFIVTIVVVLLLMMFFLL